MEQTTKITYTVRKNHLNRTGNGSHGYWAHVIRSSNTVNMDFIVNEMAGKNTTVSRQDIIVVLDLFREMVKDLLRKGFQICTDIFSAYVTIKGSFDSNTEKFTNGKHVLKFNMKPSNDMAKDVERLAELRKVDKDPEYLKLYTVYDFMTKTSNQTVSAGCVCELRGKNIFVDTARDDHGIFFVRSGSDIEVRVADIDRQTPKKIFFTVPETLDPGDYVIEIRGGRSSAVRKSRLDAAISVQNNLRAA
jgi:hypothetical protein